MNSKKRLSISLTALIALCLGLCVTSFALGYTFLRVEDNFFHTGTVDIELQESNFVIQGSSTGDFLFEPGMRVYKTFTIENKSTDPNGVWYKLYFDNIRGNLADIIDVTVYDGNAEVLSGKLSALTRANTNALDQLAFGQSRTFKVEFHYPESEGNAGQGGTAEFTICAEAVQRKNNPTGLFN